MKITVENQISTPNTFLMSQMEYGTFAICLTDRNGHKRETPVYRCVCATNQHPYSFLKERTHVSKEEANNYTVRNLLPGERIVIEG